MKALSASFLLFVVAACSSSGSSSSSSSGGGAIAPVSGALVPADAAKAAVLFGSCVPDDRSNRILARMYDHRESDPREDIFRNSVSCVAARSDGCAAVTACIGVTVTIDAACKEGCTGDIATSCDDSVKFTQDCARAGAKCYASGKKVECAFEPPVTCTGTASSCVDGRTSFCNGETTKKGAKCADYFGSSCVTADDFTGCKGPGAACDATQFSGLNIEYQGQSCAGSTLKACMNGGSIDVDCGTVGVGFTCQTVGATSFCGTASECEPAKDKPTCDGTSLVLCNAGKTEKVDCTALGFTGCSAQLGVCTPSGFGN